MRTYTADIPGLAHDATLKTAITRLVIITHTTDYNSSECWNPLTLANNRLHIIALTSHDCPVQMFPFTDQTERGSKRSFIYLFSDAAAVPCQKLSIQKDRFVKLQL